MVKPLTRLLMAAVLLLAGATAHSSDLLSSGGGSQYRFRDDLWVGGEPAGGGLLLSPLWRGAADCAARLRSCDLEFRRADLLTSVATDDAANAKIDLNGHLLGVSGVVTIERVERSGFFLAFGLAATWEVGGEQVFDDGGEHAWEILPSDASPLARWLPIRSFLFTGSSLPRPGAAAGAPTSREDEAEQALRDIGLLAGPARGAGVPPVVLWPPRLLADRPAGTVPEASTWEMLGVGFAALACARLIGHDGLRWPGPG